MCVPGGTISVVFDADECVKEIDIPIYNQPTHSGQLQFKVSLKSPPGGPKTGSPCEAEVVITFVAMGKHRLDIVRCVQLTLYYFSSHRPGRSGATRPMRCRVHQIEVSNTKKHESEFQVYHSLFLNYGIKKLIMMQKLEPRTVGLNPTIVRHVDRIMYYSA